MHTERKGMNPDGFRQTDQTSHHDRALCMPVWFVHFLFLSLLVACFSLLFRERRTYIHGQVGDPNPVLFGEICGPCAQESLSRQIVVLAVTISSDLCPVGAT